MAITDVLRGLLGGAGGALAGYGIQQQREQERLERERIRQEAAAEREADRAYRRQRDERQDALSAALQDVQMAEMGYRVAPEMAATGATFAPEAPELMSVLEDLRPTAMDIPAPARPETRDGRIRGTDVGVAPGQTYSAVQKALMDAERERPEPQPDTRVVMERGPRPIEARLPSAEERGAQVLRFPGDRTYVRERQLTPAEQREVDLEGDAADVVAAGRAMGLNLTTEQGRAVASGKVRFADLIPEAPPRGPAPTALMQNYEYIRSQRGQEEADKYLQSQMGGAGGGLPAAVISRSITELAKGKPIYNPEDPEFIIGYEEWGPGELEAEAAKIRNLASLLSGDMPEPAPEPSDRADSPVNFFDFTTGGRFDAGQRGTGAFLRAPGAGALPMSEAAPLSPEQERRLQLGFSEEEALEPDTYAAPTTGYVPQRGVPSYREIGPTNEDIMNVVRMILDAPTYRIPSGG